MKKPWLKRMVIGLLFLATLVVLFYAEEDWRGARELARVKKELKAKGESLDPKELNPPPIPDEINVAAAPVFAELYEETPGGKTARLRAFRQFFFDSQRAERIAHTKAPIYDGLDSRDEFSLAAWQKVLADRSDPATALGDVREAFDQMEPLTGEVEAALARPGVSWPKRFPDDPLLEARPYLGQLMPLSRFFGLRGMVAVEGGDGAAALGDIDRIFRIAGTLDHQMLIGYLVRSICLPYAYRVVSYGLRKGVWSDAQLAELDALLAHQDELHRLRQSLREDLLAELADSPLELARVEADRRRILQLLAALKKLDRTDEVLSAEKLRRADLRQADARRLFLWLRPRGWRFLDDAKMLVAGGRILQAVDVGTGRVDAAEIDGLQAALQRDNGGWRAILFRQSLEHTGESVPPLQKAAYNQALVVEARAACALERERLRTGTLPNSLLVATVDPIGGEPLHYVREEDGYLLYSIGWDRKDDGGAIVRKASGRIDPLQGDWPWPSRPDLLTVKTMNQ